ncbi:sigma-70 family RNA polymerase sigma factor [Actinoplanes auranticolor]|uniref:DNA-directed RNA polymerase sigma-70 factor n=1 Tax=Actinoplanes auranticolor TaxID=47988 RepID=A0A919SM20_9ACTN|nr:sigma-70 family RNA polymerase sigma factor [Actinoplanes auranticolor]GIM73403.1 DNA-directed RNA polymerase sigma-70 factor [Actinoplanes auranticolor]
MAENAAAAELFETHRGRLRAVAYRMLGSLAEADDAVQDAWLRLDRAGTQGVENPGAWLTTVVARICLNKLRERAHRREEALDVHVSDPILSRADGTDPEQQALLADAVGLALLVVLETLTPAERLAYVLHDMFAVPFEDVATVIDRSPAAARQLASRARRRLRSEAPAPDPDLARQRQVVDAFFAASRAGDFEALVAVLDPDVILRSDAGPGRPRLNVVLRGASTVAGQAFTARRLSPFVHPALVNGAAGVVVVVNGRLFSVMAFTVVAGRVVAIDVLADADRLAKLDLTALDLPPEPS